MKKVFLIFLLAIVLCGCNRKNDNTIIMVTEAGFAPYEFYEGNEIVGVDIEIANEIANSLGKKLVIKDVDFNSIISELDSNKADFAAAGLSITEERKKNVDFSIEYTTSKQVIIVRNDYNKIKSLDDLKDKVISVQLGSVADYYVEENYPDATLVTQKKFLTASEDVKSGKSDCIIMDYLPAKEIVENNEELVILDVEVFTDKYALAVKKGNTNLLNSINEVLERLINEGKIKEYIIKYSS